MFAALVFTVATARLSDETSLQLARTPMDFLSTLHAPLRSGCIATNQCYNGNNPAGECCVGHVIDDPIHCTEGLTCGACETAAKYLVGALVKEGCALIIPEGVVTCEALGFGPEDPFADVCAVIVGVSCPIISALVKKGLSDPAGICQKIGYCSSGGGTGRIFGTKCGCVETGYCTANDSGCCSGNASYGFNHCVAIGLKICTA